MGSLLNGGSMPLDGLLNKSVAKHGDLVLIYVDHICNKDMYVSISFMVFS